MAGHTFTPEEARAAALKAAPRGPSKTTVEMRRIIEAALESIDAPAELRKLAVSLDPSDRKTFWALAGKLLPQHIEATLTGSHSALTEAAGAVPPHVVDAMLAAGRAAMLAPPNGHPKT